MKEPVIALAAVFCNVIAQLAMKYAGRHGQTADGLAMWFSPWLFSAVFFYGISFLLTVRVFAENPLTIASPAMTGCTFLLIALSGSLLLGESFGWQKVMGILIILIGIVVLVRS